MFHKFPICSRKSRYLCFFSVSDLMRLDSMTLLCKHFDKVDPIKIPPVPTGRAGNRANFLSMRVHCVSFLLCSFQSNQVAFLYRRKCSNCTDNTSAVSQIHKRNRKRKHKEHGSRDFIQNRMYRHESLLYDKAGNDVDNLD